MDIFLVSAVGLVEGRVWGSSSRGEWKLCPSKTRQLGVPWSPMVPLQIPPGYPRGLLFSSACTGGLCWVLPLPCPDWLPCLHMEAAATTDTEGPPWTRLLLKLGIIILSQGNGRRVNKQRTLISLIYTLLMKEEHCSSTREAGSFLALSNAQPSGHRGVWLTQACTA